MKYRAINYKDYLVYLVESDVDQSENDIIISKELYDEMLKANQEKQAEIRVIENKDKTLSVKDFYDRKPSKLHTWNRKTQKFEISEEDNDQLKIDVNTAFLSSESDRTEVAIKKLQRVIDRNIATDEEAQHFDDLEIYSIKLMRVPNQETWPLNPVWPECPEFFSE